MSDIINITRTYRFVDGIPLINSQLDSEIQNIVERVNKNISYVTTNVYLTSVVTSTSALSMPATTVYGDITSLTIPNGEWDVQGNSIFFYTAAGTGADNMSYASGLSLTSGNAGIDDSNFPMNIVGYRPYIDFTLNRQSKSPMAFPPTRFNSTPAGTTVYLKMEAVYDSTKGSLVAYGSIVARKVNT